jgi:hypothetical protein
VTRPISYTQSEFNYFLYLAPHNHRKGREVKKNEKEIYVCSSHIEFDDAACNSHTTPVFACKREKTTVVPCRFTAVASGAPSLGKVWWTCDNSILHVRGATESWGLFLNPGVQIGTMEDVIYFDFNTKTGKGYATEIWQMTFIAGPYGVGTLEGIAIDKVTSLYSAVTGYDIPLSGDFTGHIVAFHGTGDFEKATLSANVIGEPFLLPSPPYPPGSWDERIFVGWDGTSPPVATGRLTFHG